MEKSDDSLLSKDFCALLRIMPLFMNKGIEVTVSSSVSLNPMGILQEKLLKRMSSLWKMREEIQSSLNQEAKTTQSFEVRIKTFLFICRNIDIIYLSFLHQCKFP